MRVHIGATWQIRSNGGLTPTYFNHLLSQRLEMLVRAFVFNYEIALDSEEEED